MQDPLSLLLNQENKMPGEASQKSSGLSTARQTRRRTSPEDQATLEAAYQQNSKPDKTARIELCHKVTMGEKEISVSIVSFTTLELHLLTAILRQIWFQNKRQVSRRRSRPAFTAEDVSSTLPSSQSSTQSVTARVEIGSQEPLLEDRASTPNTTQSTVASEHEEISIECSKVEILSETPDDHNTSGSIPQDESPQPTLTQPSSSNPSEDVKSENKNSVLLSVSQPAGDLNDRRLPEKTSLSSKKSQDPVFTLHHEAQALSSDTKNSLPASLKRTLSQPRLCTSLDGSVRVKTGLSPTPSPPRPQSTANGRQTRMTGPLQRSQSAMLPSTCSSFGSSSSFGRSRDSRTWEFFCDAASRNELTRAAELEQTGSAAGAIALMRSASTSTTSSAATGMNANKRSSPASGKLDSQKRMKADNAKTSSKPKLARTSSSVACLQTNTNSSNTARTTEPRVKSIDATDLENKPKKKTYTIDIYQDGNDSDKENWVPGTQVSAPPRRSRKARASPTSNILRENSYLSSQPTSLNPRANRGMGRHGNCLGPKQDEENEDSDDDDDDEEVTQFMGRRGSSGLVLGRGGDAEDMAGVHGLLSLSQGAWR
ncbi:MAG: hypothetical protein Q9208_008057 [Pyrenodesmia sp. 3 TL-2023]